MRSRMLVLPLVLLAATAASAQDVRAPRLHVLDNGLRLLTVEDPGNPIVTVTWSAHVGDSAEPLDFAGNSHYLEHLLLFRGTEAYPGNEIGEWVAGRGGYFNGHTWYDYTTFEIMVAARDLDDALARHQQMMFHAAFSGEDFETEKKAVFEELRSGMDQPYGYLWRTAPYRMYPAETFYSRSTIGTIETVEAATVERVTDYYRSYYVPNNMTMAVVGNIDTDETVRLVTERFAGYEAGSVPDALYEALPLKPGVQVIAEEREVGKAYFLMAIEGPSASEPEYYPWALLASYLANGNTSLLRDELVTRQSLLDEISVSAMPRRFPLGWQAIDGDTSPDRMVDALGELWSLLAGVAAEGVTEEELELARRRLVTAHRVRLDDQLSVASRLVESDAHGDYRLFSEYEERLAGVSAIDVQAVARKYLTPDHFFLMALFPPGEIPEGFEDAVREAAAASSRSGAAVRSIDLASRATLLHEARPGAMESFTVAVQAGARDGAPGLANAVATMMARQSEDWTRKELQDHLDRQGFRLESWVTSDAAFFSLQAPAGATATAAHLLTRLLTAPGFPDEEWESVRTELLANLQMQLDRPRAMAVDALNTAAFAGTPYGRSIEETRGALTGLEVKDLRGFWKERYRTGGLAVAYSGGATVDELTELLAPLSELRGDAAGRSEVRPVELDGVAREARPMEGKAQTNLYLAWPAPPLDSDDWIRWELAERALGGDLAGRLWKLRQEEGLAYSVWLNSMDRRAQPLAYLYMATAGEKREKALAAIDREVRRAVEGLRPEELERVKVSYLANLDRLDRTAERRSNRMAEWWSQGLGADYRDRLRRVVAATTLDDVNRVVADVLDPDRYYFAEAGAVPE